MPVAMPAIDQDTCSEWQELDRNLYQTYPYWLAKTQVERRKTWSTFGKLCKSRPWKPNMGPKMRGVRKNPSPHIRQFVNPQPLSSSPKEDIMRITETYDEAILYWQDFGSPALDFLPSFQDFIDHAMDHGEDIMEKIERFEELFYRTMMFHMSPFMFVCVGDHMVLERVPAFDGTSLLDSTKGKTTATLTALYNKHKDDLSSLTLASLSHAEDIMEVDLGILPFQGSGLPEGDNAALDQMYMLITHSEAYRRFSFDPYLQANKNCQLDVVNGHFKGKIFGTITSKLEHAPINMKIDGTFPEPELETGNNLEFNQNEPVPNPEYSDPANAPITFSWFCGNIGYEKINTGPPPSAFTGNKPPKNFPAMSWNGEVYLTKDFLLECPDPVTGEIRYKTNSKGRKIKYESTLALGCFAKQRRSVIPIMHLRKRGM